MDRRSRQEWLSQLTRYLCLAIFVLQMTGCVSERSSMDVMDNEEIDAAFPDGFAPGPRMGSALVVGDAWVRTTFQPTVFEHEHDHDLDEDCPGLPYREEYGGVEINTGRCHQITLTQPSLIGVSAGERLRIIAWHSQLISEDSDTHTGTMMLAVGENLIWAERSPIPGAARSFDLVLQIQVDIAPGEPVRLHVHNHGANAWNLLSIERVE